MTTNVEYAKIKSEIPKGNKRKENVMKRFRSYLALALVLSLALLSLASCDKSGSIKKDFEEAGYTVSVISAKNEKAEAIFTLLGYTEDEIEEISEYELIYCVDGIVKNALIVKYPSAAELKDELVDDGSEAFYNELKADGKINGNCRLLYAIGGADEIFLGK